MSRKYQSNKMTKTLFQSAQRTCQILAALEHLEKDVAGTAYVSGPGMTSTSKLPNNDNSNMARVSEEPSSHYVMHNLVCQN